MGFPGGTVVKNPLPVQETRTPSLGQEDPETATTPVLLPGESHGQRSLVGYGPRVAKSWTRLSTYTRVRAHTHTHTHIK